MPLNDLSQPELESLIDALLKVGEATQPLHSDGLNPRIDLTPGNEVRITLSYRMPAAEADAAPAVKAALEGRAECLASIEALPADPPPPRAWTAEEEHQVAEIYARNRLLTPFCDPAYEAAQATGREKAEISAYVRAHLYPLCDQHLERLRATPSTEAAPTPSGAVASTMPEPVDPPPVVEGPAGGTLSYDQEDDIDERAFSFAPEQSVTGMPEPIPPAASPQDDPSPVTRAVEESGGGQATAAAAPPAAPVPGSASALAESAGGAKVLWTKEEDDRLVAFIVDQVTTRGITKSAALPLAAAELGRPVPGTEFRANRKLKDRINAEIFAAATRQAQTEIPVAPSSEAARQDAPPPQAEVQGESAEPPVEDAPASVPEPGAGGLAAEVDPLQAHIASLPRKDGWTLERDVEFLELMALGWKENEIALEMKIQAKLLRPRLDLLTGANQDDKGRLQRRFGATAVFAALQAKLAQKAA